MISTGTHRQRRERLAALVGEGIAIVPTAPERFRNRDSTYPYRFDSYFYYLTGFPEPEAVLVIVCGAHPRSLLFCRDKNPERELWDGFRHGPDAAREAFGFDEAHSIDLLDEQLPKLLGDRRRIAYAVGADAAWDARVMDWLNRVRAAARAGVHAPTEIADIRAPLDEMRLVKDAEELDVMRAAARISASAHRRAMAVAGPGMHEHEIEAELLHEFRRRGAQFPAYSPIVASGANACILHYVENRACIAPGSLLLIDAGCELDGYAADITRTFPVDGRFSGPQRDIYELVLEAQAQAIRAVRPGATFADPHDAAVGVLVRGLIDLGLLQGSAEAAIESESYKRFYMHRTGHWLGLDVHDAGEYKRDGRWRELAPGMVLTVEPGLYVREAGDVPEAFWNIGVRIEDDVLVTAQGHEVLTAEAPKAVGEVESLVGSMRTA